MMKKISCEIIQIIERQSIDESIFLENTLSHKGFYDFKTKVSLWMGQLFLKF